ncbi:MAG: PilW family protein [Syntrophaceae bacterium]|nr:PilW family protein [Syntrophaceae bacterium]
MKRPSTFGEKGITLIELLVALIIFGFAIGAIYRLFIVQTRAYTVHEEVVDVQQNVRSAMEVMLRDLRMTGYDDDATTSVVTIPTPIATPVQASDITVSYEYQNQRYTVRYWRDAPTLELRRQLTRDATVDPAETLLNNVDTLTFTYGLDANGDGNMDDQNGDGVIDNNDWVTAAGVGTSKVIAVRVTLAARPATDNPDVQTRVSPRSLTSAVTLRNLVMK